MRRLLLEAAWELVRARLLVAFVLRRSLPALLAPRAPGAPHAHAWLEAGSLIITGQDGMDLVTPLPNPAPAGGTTRA